MLDEDLLDEWTLSLIRVVFIHSLSIHGSLPLLLASYGTLEAELTVQYRHRFGSRLWCNAKLNQGGSEVAQHSTGH